MNGKKIIVINLGWEQEPLLDKLGEFGINIYGIHYNDGFYKAPRYRDILIRPFRDLVNISRFAEKIKPDAVISDQCDYSYFAQSLIAEKLNLPGPRLKEAQIATNKYFQRLKSKQQGILIPEFQLCSSLDELYSFIAEVGLPVITKPIDNRASLGVNKIQEDRDIPFAFYDALENCFSKRVLAEKFINGVDITVDGYIFKEMGPKALGLATKRKLVDKRGIIDGAITYPGDLDDELYNKTIKTAEDTVKKLGFSFGFFHAKYIITPDKEVYLVDVVNRGGGVFTSDVIIPHVSGIDVLDIFVKDVLNMPTAINKVLPDKVPTLMKFISFTDIRGKEVRNIKGVKEVQDDVHTVKLKMLIKRGDKVNEILSGADRHGVIIVTAAKRENLLSQAESLIERLVVESE